MYHDQLIIAAQPLNHILITFNLPFIQHTQCDMMILSFSILILHKPMSRQEQHLFNSKPHHWHNRLLKSDWMLCRAWQQLLFKTSCPTSKHSSKHTWKSTQVNKSPGGERKQNTKQLSTSKWIHTAKQIRVLLLAAEFPSGRCMCFELLKIPIFLPKILHGTCCQMPCLCWSSHKTHLRATGSEQALWENNPRNK